MIRAAQELAGAANIFTRARHYRETRAPPRRRYIHADADADALAASSLARAFSPTRRLTTLARGLLTLIRAMFRMMSAISLRRLQHMTYISLIIADGRERLLPKLGFIFATICRDRRGRLPLCARCFVPLTP